MRKARSTTPNSRMFDLCYTASPEGYDVAVRIEGKGSPSVVVELGVLSREEMLQSVVDLFQQEKEKQDILYVRVFRTKYPMEEDRPQFISRDVIGDMETGDIETAAGLIVGKLYSFFDQQLSRSVSRYMPLRQIPGTEQYECPACGRGAGWEPGAAPWGAVSNTQPLRATTQTITCTSCATQAYIVITKFRGPCVDLVQMIHDHPFVKDFFINQPWNPEPPWMKRTQLLELLNKEHQ